MIAMAALAIFLLRDRPRQIVESRLSAALGAKVHIGRFWVRALDHFEIEGLVIDRPPAWPFIARIEIDRVDIHGKLDAIIKGRYRSIDVAGLAVMTRRPTAPSRPPPRQPFTVDTLTVADARIVAPDGDARIEVALDARELGRDASGTLRLIGTAELGDDDFVAAPWRPLLGTEAPAVDVDLEASGCGAAPVKVHVAFEPGAFEPGAFEPGAVDSDLALRGSATLGDTRATFDAKLGSTPPTFDLRVTDFDAGCWRPTIPAAPSVGAGRDPASTVTVEDGTIDLEAKRPLPSAPIAFAGTARGLGIDFEGAGIEGSGRGDATFDGSLTAAGGIALELDIDLDEARFETDAADSGMHIGSGRLKMRARGDRESEPLVVSVEGAIERIETDASVRGVALRHLRVPSLAAKVSLAPSADASDSAWHADTDLTLDLEPEIDHAIEGALGRLLDAIDDVTLRVAGDVRGAPSTVGFEGRIDVATAAMNAAIEGSASRENDILRFTGASRLTSNDRHDDDWHDDWGDLAYRGSFTMAPEADTGRANGRWSWTRIPVSRLASMMPASRASPPTLAATAARMDGRIAGRLSNPRVTGTLTLDGLEIGDIPGADSESRWPVDRIEADSITFEMAREPTGRWRLTVPMVPITLSGPEGSALDPPLEVDLDLGIEVDGDIVAATSIATSLERSILVANANLDARKLGRFTLARDAPGAFTAEVAGADVPAWLDRLRFEAVPAEYTVTGDLDASLRFERGDLGAAGVGTSGTGTSGRGTSGKGGPWNLEGRLTLGSAGFASDDGSRVAEGLAAALEVRGRVEGDVIALSGDGRLTGPLVLWGTAFGDYSHTDFDASFDARSEMAHGEGRRWNARARLSPVTPSAGLRLDLGLDSESDEAVAGDGGLTVTGALVATDLAEAYRQVIAVPFAGTPRVEGLSIAGAGRLAIESWQPGRKSVRGVLDLDAVDLATAGETFAVGGLDLELPFELDPAATTALDGHLAFERLVAAGLTFSPARTPIRVEGDTIGLIERLESRVAGGTLGLEGLRIGPLLRPDRQLETALTLDGLVLARLTKALGLPTFEGSLDGQVPRVRLGAKAFEVEGDAVLQALGGSIRLFDITGRDFFSRFPRVTFSADLTTLDLERLTGAFSFGRMAGTIDGAVRKCTLVKAQPVACTARIESTTGRREKRWIDVEAVNNLSVLGTGGGLQQTFVRRFLSRFTYDKLGISVRLADDRFLLRGLARRGDRELFLKGRLPFPINVVNGDPGATVSFQVMLDRLRNFDQARIDVGRRPKPPSEKPP